MKYILRLLLLGSVPLFFACKKSDSNSSASTDYTFTIRQSINGIQVLDNVSFAIEAEPTTTSATNIVWYLNGAIVNNTYSNYVKRFLDPGNYTIRADFDYYVGSTKKSTSITKSFTVTDLPNNMVTLNKVEINAMLNAGTFYVSPYYFMKLKLLLKEKDENNTESIKYISPENSQNWGVHNMIYPISFDLNTLNYKMKVFKTGNIYPNPTYHTEISIQSAKQYLGSQEPFIYYDYFHLDLNSYRSIKPSTIDISSGGVQYKLYVTWN